MPDKSPPPAHMPVPDAARNFPEQQGESTVEARKDEQRTGEVEASPVCTLCYALVADMAAHTQWHNSTGTNPPQENPNIPPRPIQAQGIK